MKGAIETLARLGRLGARAAIDTPEDWRPGDLAECVNRGAWFNAATGRPATHDGPSYGERYVVAGVRSGPDGLTMLGFARFAGRKYAARAFRKVQPRADEAIAGDAAFLETVRPRELVQ